MQAIRWATAICAALTLTGCPAETSGGEAAADFPASSRPTTAQEMEKKFTAEVADLTTSDPIKVADVECEGLADDGSEWTCDVRELGSRTSRPYYVEVGEDGDWAATPDAPRAGKPQAAGDATRFKPIVHKGCGNRVLPPVDLPADATLRWTHPGGGYLIVRGEAADPKSANGYPKRLSVASQKTERTGEEFVEAGTYKGTEVSPDDADACWTLRFEPYE